MAQPGQPTAIILAIKGLYLNPSTFGYNPALGNTAPPGALTIADNVVIDRPSVVATRRGFDNSYSTITSGSANMFQFNNIKLVHTFDHRLLADKLDNGVFTQYNQPTGGYVEPNNDITTGSRVRGLETNKSFYFITDDGTWVLDHVDGQPRKAGAPAGLGGSAAVNGAGTGFLHNNTSIAYRVVFGYKDYNQQLVLGAPSSRIIVTNTSGSDQEVTVTFQYPKEVQLTPQDFIFQLYRSAPTANTTYEPDDELSLTYEDVCSNLTQSSTGSVTLTDITPDVLLGASLYTNQSQDGVLQSNYRPPWAVDINTFKQYTFYANTRTLQTTDLTLIASGAGNGPDAMIAGDTIVFTQNGSGGPSFTLTAVTTTNNPSLGQFQIQDSGGTNPALDIQVAATNLCLVANAMAGNQFLTANYVSNYNEVPGKMSFSRLTLTKDTFTITPSRSSCWEQAVPTISSNDERPNRIYFSKFNQPGAVPLVNYIEVGSANQPINRILPIRNGLIVMKQDGVYYITNAAPPFTITPIDYNIRILADNTAAELDNNIYFLSDQGIVALNDSSAGIKSYILDRTIIQNTSPDLFPNLKQTAWGLAYQSDRKYILAMPTTGSDTQATQQYVYNHLNDLWVRWTLKGTCAIILKKDGKMYMGSNYGSAPGTNNSYVYQERKTYTNTDYVDNQYASTISSIGPTTTIVINNPSLPTGVSILDGWTITQTATGSQARVINSVVGTSFTTLTLDSKQNWTTTAIEIYTPVYSEIQTIQIDAQNPGMNKQYNEIIYLFTEQNFTQVLTSITSNTAGVPSLDYIVPNNSGGWGIDPWGPTPWGGVPIGQGKVRRYLPQPVQRCGWLYINISNAEAFTSFGLSGFEIYYKDTSTRQK